MTHEQRSCLTVEGVIRIRVPEELREKHFEDIDHIWCNTDIRVAYTIVTRPRTKHRRPCLVNDVETDRATAGHGDDQHKWHRGLGPDVQLVDVRVEYLVHEAYAG